MGTDNLKLCTIGKNLFHTGPTESADQFFMLPLPSKIQRLNSTGNEPVNVLWATTVQVFIYIKKEQPSMFHIFFFVKDTVSYFYISSGRVQGNWLRVIL